LPPVALKWPAHYPIKNPKLAVAMAVEDKNDDDHLLATADTDTINVGMNASTLIATSPTNHSSAFLQHYVFSVIFM